jgi:CRP-like cAMP-binding protein
MNKNHAFLNSFINVPENTFNKLQEISTFKEIEANKDFTKTGEIPMMVYLSTSGLMGAYLHSECGKVFNKNIFGPFSFVGALTALIRNEPSELTYKTLTLCKGYEINFKALRELCETDIIISNLYNKILERIYITYEKKQFALISLDASQRYLKLKEQFPDIDNLIPQFQIASYLSITPVQLSRIRKKLN